MIQKIAVFLLLVSNLSAQVFPTEMIKESGPLENRVNFLIMGDGYTSTEQGKFKLDAQDVMDELFLESPFLEYKAFFNTAIVKVPSVESGTDHPATATDQSEPVFPVATRNTYFQSTFDGYSIHRLVISNESSKVYSVAATNFPSYDQILLIVNSPNYGGSGGPFSTFTDHAESAQIAIHELGHSFGDLKDEYWAGSSFASEGANMTQQSDPSLVVWKNWVGINDIGVYSYGTGSASSWYRPHESCKMRFLNQPFCSVCKETFIDKIYQLVSPIDAYEPSDLNQEFTGSPIIFSLDLVYPNPNTIQVSWDLDDNVLAGNVTTMGYSGFPSGTSTMTATVVDKPTMSKLDSSGYVFTVSWEIENATATVAVNQDKLFYKIYPNPTLDKLYVVLGGDFPEKETVVELVNASGKVVLSEKKQLSQKSVMEINIASFPSGNYFVKIKRGHLMQTVSIILGE